MWTKQNMTIHQIIQPAILPSPAETIDLLYENISEGPKMFKIKFLKILDKLHFKLNCLFPH